METRADVGREEFHHIATTPEEDGWLTGRFLLFRPEIERIEGWREWGSVGNRSLTRQQRTLYALSSAIYYAHRSGGIVDWFEQQTVGWSDLLSLIGGFPWPSFVQRFEAAFFSQFGRALSPERAVGAWNERRKLEHREMLATARKIALKRSGKVFDEYDLCILAMRFAEEGIMSVPVRVSEGAHEFGEWCRLGDAKAQSVFYVRAWLLENEPGLRRPEGTDVAPG